MDTIIGIGFYRREQYPLLLETAEDRNEIEQTYDEWLEGLRKGIKLFREEGVNPVKVDVDLNELLAYCEKHGLKNNGKTRAEFFAKLVKDGRWKKIEFDLL